MLSGRFATTLCWTVSLLSLGPVLRAAPVTVPQCRDVTLQASFLAEDKPGQGAGFYLVIQNLRSTPIAVPDPTPLSVHWYAQSPGGKWLWRASGGDGGSLVNALAEHGPLFADTGANQPGQRTLRTIEPHQSYAWSAFSGQTPALRYRPGCEHCTYQGESQFHAVLAYAYLPPASQRDPRLLTCGLRSAPVVMPPLAPEATRPHNSASR